MKSPKHLILICGDEEYLKEQKKKELLDALVHIHGEKKPIVARFFGDHNGKIDIDTKVDEGTTFTFTIPV